MRLWIAAMFTFVVLLILAWVFRNDPAGLREWNDE